MGQIIVLLVLLSSAVLAQQVAAVGPMPISGQPVVDQTHAVWPSPESLVRGLRSSDQAVRLKALRLVGVNDPMTKIAEVSGGSEIGERIRTPDQVVLQYAPLGRDSSKQAILTVQLEDYLYVGVGFFEANRWERIGTSACWCKYDMPNPLGEFVQLVAAPDLNVRRFELVIRDSSGGTGVYTQNEAHFRLYNGKLRRVLSYVSRYKLCSPTDPQSTCTIEKRWFNLPLFEFGRYLPGGVLVEGRGQFTKGKSQMPAFL
jgi:hypothetical protein